MEFRDIAQDHGIPYLIVLLPAKGAGDANIDAIKQQFDKDKINYYDLFPLAQSFSLKDFSVTSSDMHPSALVHQKIGEMLSEYILKNYLKGRQAEDRR